MTDISSSVPTNAVLLIDRFVSASSAQDAIESLEGMIDGFKNKEDPWEKDWILSNTDVLDQLTHLLQHGTLKNGDLPCGDEGINLVCQLYQVSLAQHKDSLLQPAPGQLLEALLDVMDNSERQIYTRVLALNVLGQLSQKHSTIATTQWLQAPNGLHRLADMLSLGVENPVEEVVRNQAMAVADILAKDAAISKVFLFAEVECKLLDICWQQGGLTKGNPVVVDALGLVRDMLQHADGSLQDLVWQRPSVASRLAQLMDLRGADEFLHPEKYKKKSKGKQGVSSKTEDDNDDDLDNLLQSGGSAKTAANEQNKEGEADFYIPRVSEAEEVIVENVIQVLHLLLESESLRPEVWKNHTGMCSLVWELALVNPANPPVCAMPSALLQQKALELVALKFHDLQTMDRHAGLDRLLFLVCTGGANAKTYEEKMGTSQAALAVLRKILDGDRIHELLLHTLAPPPEEGAPSGPTVVQKLWNTVVENLSTSESTDDPKTRSIFLSGALGGLSLLLYDEQSREMMSKVVPEAANADIMLEAIQTEADSVVRWALLRFLCEWVMDTPLMVQKLLSSTASTHLAPMATSLDKDYAPLVHLLLGLSMEYLRGDEQACGGWTRAGILRVIQKVGISKYTSSLEGLKKAQTGDLPCFASNLEFDHWAKWYKQAVWIVRKRVVKEMASENAGDDSDGDDGAEGESKPSSTSAATKSLQKMITQQSKEMEDLRLELEEAKIKINSQEQQLSTWKRRMESNPTELDGMLSEMTSKTANLEEKIVKLETEAKSTKLQHEEEVKSLNSLLNDVRQEADESRASAQEAREDREQMEQELSALSQAYSNLEEDFQRERSASRSLASAGAPTAESGQPQQSQGEVSQQQSSSGSTEVSTLRAENTRLRNDARAADEWMQLAVTKMNEMGVRNSNLEQQVGALTEELDSLRTQAAAVQQQQGSRGQAEEKAKELGESILRLESELEEAKALQKDAAAKAASREEELLSQLDTERTYIEDLRFKFSTAEEERRNAIDEKVLVAQKLDEERDRASAALAENEKLLARSQMPAPSAASREEELLSQLDVERTYIEELKFKLSTAEEERRNAVDEKVLVEQKLDEERDRASAALAENEKLLARSQMPAPSGAAENGTVSPAETNESIIAELDAARNELKRNRDRFEEDIYKKESRIRELEDRLGSGLGSFKVEDIRARDEEIEELRAANEAAQEWMSKAVEHHQLLSAQVASLSDEKSSLIGRLKSLEREVAPVDTNGKMYQLEQELEQKSMRIAEMEASLLENKEEIGQMKADKEKIKGMKQDLGIARDDIAILQKQLAESQDTIQSLEQQISENSLQSENEDLKASNKELQEQLDEFQSWADMVQKKISEVLGEKKRRDEFVTELQAGNESLRNENSALSEQLAKRNMEIERLKTSMEDNTRYQIEAKEESREASDGALQKQMAELKERAETAENSVSEILAEKEISDKALLELAAGTEALREEITSLSDELQAKNKEIEMLQVDLKERSGSLNGNDIQVERGPESEDGELFQKQIHQMEEEIRVAEVNLTAQADVVHQWEVRVAELEAEIASMNSQIKEQEGEAKAAIAQWQESYAESDSKCSVLEKEVETLRAEKVELERLVGKSSYNSEAFQKKQVFLDKKISSLEDAIDEELDEMKNEGAEIPSGGTRKVVSKLRVGSEVEGGEVFQQKIHPMDEETLAAQADVVQQWELRVAELEAEIASMNTQIQEQEEEANAAIAQWQESYAETDSKCSALEKEVETLRAEKIGREKSAEKSSYNSEAFEKKQMFLDKKISSLEDAIDEELDEMKNESPEIPSGHTRKVSKLREELGNVSNAQVRRGSEAEDGEVFQQQLHPMEEENLAAQADVVQQWEVRVAELEAEIASMNTQIQEQEEEANAAIAQWQESYAETDNRCSALEKEVETLRAGKIELEKLVGTSSYNSEEFQKKKMFLGKVSSLEDAEDEELDEMKNEIRSDETPEVVSKLREELKNAQATISRDEEVVHQWEDRASKLESAIQSLEIQLEEQENEAKNVIARWQESFSKADDKCAMLEKELETSRAEVHELKAFAETSTRGEAPISVDESIMKQWEDKTRALEAEIVRLNNSLRDEQLSYRDNLANLQENFSLSEKKCEHLQEELDLMTQKEALVADLEAEIERLKETLHDQQMSSSDAIEKLQEKASASERIYQELRQEVDRMTEKESYFAEVEAEITRLKTALLDQETSSSDTIKELQETLSAWEERCGMLNEQINRMEQEELKLKQTLRDHSEQQEKLKSEKEVLEKSISQLEQENSLLQGNLGESAKVAEPSGELFEQLERSESSHRETLQALERAEGELRDAQEALIADEEVIGQWEERVAELDSTIQSLEAQLEEQENEANTAISQWQNRTSELEAKLSNVEEELLDSRKDLVSRDATIEKLQGLDDDLSSEQQRWRQEVDGLKAELAGEKGRHSEARDEIAVLTKTLDELKKKFDDTERFWTELAAERNSTIESLQTQSQENEAKTRRVITELQTRSSELEAAMSKVTKELDESRDTIVAKDDKIEKIQTDVAMFKSEIKALKESSESDNTRAELAASRAENELLNEKLSAEEKARRLEAEKFNRELATEKMRYQEARDEIEALSNSFDELRTESESVVTQWTDRVSELEEVVEQLHKQLQQQEEEANVAIESWESKTLELERDLETKVQELATLKEKTVKALEEDVGTQAAKLKALEAELKKASEDRDRLRDSLASKSTERLEAERDRLTVVVGQLEEELRIANDVVQTYVTDEAAEKATELTSNALRDEVNDLKCEIDDYKHQIEVEKSAREVAELEIDRLRDDIATLAALTNPGGSADDLHLRTAQAAEKLRKKERIEIEELRRSLYRALDDVEIARDAEREAVQKLAKVRLQTSVCEQEIVAAKSEIHFLTQALEDLHQDEENKRASLEYRIGSLEDENDLLRKYHAGELEEAQQELSQVTMEKDRAVHHLREVEKTNASLVYAASKENQASKDAGDLEDEIATLRVANAHLLAVAADDNARSERKLRESLAAQMASTEADVIMEHELRVSAEEAVRSLKAQLVELQKALRDSGDGTSGNNKDQIATESTQRQIESLEQDLKNLKKENMKLKKKLETEAAKAKASLEKVTEECRKAQSRLHKAERDGLFDAAIKSEVARLRMSPKVSTPETRDDILLLKAGPESTPTSANAAAFDLLRKHKEEIQEERKMYLEFLAEHDNLLALLAQHDVERTCLRDELSDNCGEAAVERALQRAEEKTVSQYGKIIRLAESPAQLDCA